MARADAAARLLGLWLLRLLHAHSLTVTQPCCSSFYHVPAHFGTDIFECSRILENAQVIAAEPPDACGPVADVVQGKIALISRGNCNFTEKVLNVQAKGAIAAIVHETAKLERWGVTMEGLEEFTGKIYIPSVFVSLSTGTFLRGQIEMGNTTVTLNSTGHVVRKRVTLPVDAFATSVVVSFLLLTLAGGCGLLLAVIVTCVQQSFRSRAVAGLKTIVYTRRPKASHPRGRSFELVQQYSRNLGQFFHAQEAYDALSNLLEALQSCTPEVLHGLANRAPEVWPTLQSIISADSPWLALRSHLQPVEREHLHPEPSRTSEIINAAANNSNEIQQPQYVQLLGADASDKTNLADIADSADAPEIVPSMTPLHEDSSHFFTNLLCDESSILTDTTSEPSSPRNTSRSLSRLKSCMSASNLLESNMYSDIQRRRDLLLQHSDASCATTATVIDTPFSSNDNSLLNARQQSLLGLVSTHMDFGRVRGALAERWKEPFRGLGLRFELHELSPFRTGRVRMSQALHQLITAYNQLCVSVTDRVHSTAQTCMDTALHASTSFAHLHVGDQLRRVMSSGVDLQGEQATVNDHDVTVSMCAICLEEFEEGDELTELPCEHLYHPSCIGPWLSSRSTVCPLCKRPAIPENNGEFIDKILCELVGHRWGVQWEIFAFPGMFVAVAVALTLAFLLMYNGDNADDSRSP